MRKVVVVVAGQARYPEAFKLSLAPFLQLRNAGHVASIIFSTWIGEIEKYQGLREYLGNHGVVTVEGKEPAAFAMPGFHFHQMKSLHQAVVDLECDCWVLRTRADVIIRDTETVLSIVGSNLQLPTSPLPAVFRNRVWVPFFEITHPFFIGDLVFFGHREDVLKLCNFDSNEEIYELPALENQAGNRWPTEAGAEVRRFMHPFLPHFPLLQEYRKTWRLVGFWNRKRLGLLSYNLSQEQYWRYLALYYLLLRHYFVVAGCDVDSKVFTVRGESPTESGATSLSGHSLVSPPAAVDPRSFLANFRRQPMMGNFYFCDSSAWLDNIFSNSINEPFVRNDFFRILASALAWSNSSVDRVSARSYREGLEKLAFE